MSQVKTVKIKHVNGFCIINATDFKNGEHELCEGETLGEDHQITVTISAETSPELQKTIDDVKAECEKVQAENVGLKQQIETFKSKQVKGEPADLSGLVPVEQFDAVALDLSNTKEQLSTAQGELIAFKNDVGAMKARIAELQGDDTPVGETSEPVQAEQPIDYSSMTADQLRALLEEKGIAYKARDSKPELIELLNDHSN